MCLPPRIAVLFLALACLLSSQEAKVIILDKSDTELLQGAWLRYHEANLQWDNAKATIINKYPVRHWASVEFPMDFRAMIEGRDTKGQVTVGSWTPEDYGKTSLKAARELIEFGTPLATPVTFPRDSSVTDLGAQLR